MIATIRPRLRLPLLALLVCLAALTPAPGGPKSDPVWNVDDVRPGMKGTGRTVMHGTKVEPFDVEVLGVLKNTSPGRDLVLCRLSGLDLDKTGVIAGMSGSPVTIDGKLLGAVAYAWPFGKEPIAGVTPFCQMHDFVASFERRDLVEQRRPKRVGLGRPLKINGQTYDTVTIASTFDDPVPTAGDGLWMVPLRMPVAATGFTPRSLALLRDSFRTSGLVPVQGGGAGTRIVEQEKETALEPGGPLAVALITGDFDMSGIGTVTHIEGKRVYGWGHPFFGLGTCEFPMMTGYIHTIYPRQTVSFKMGSPLRTVGVVNADVSTCIAGWLDRKPDMLPVKMTVRREADTEDRTFRVEVVRQNSLLATLVYTALTNSVDMQGDMPEELTADLHARIDVKGHGAIEIKDTYSGNGYSGGRAAQGLYYQVAQIINLLAYNSLEPIRISKIECETTIRAGRTTADVETLELGSETYAPGETLKGTVALRPYKGPLQRLPVELKLPANMPEGNYTVTVSDDLTGTRAELRENPLLTYPENLDQLFESLRLQARIKRTNLVVRVPIAGAGVALDGRALPNLPPSVVQMLGNTRRTGTQTMSTSLVSRQTTEWVVQGSESVRFTVAKNKKVGLKTTE
jgi:hypothetical protein